MAKTSNTRKPRVTYNDVLVTYMLQGVDAVSRQLIDHTNPVKCLDDAMEKIREGDATRDLSDLEDLRERFAAGRTNGRRGASPLVVGGSKTYSTQQVGEAGDLFIRLPVSLLVSAKGEGVEVIANDDGTFTVRAAQ